MDRTIKKHYGFLKKTDRCFLLFAENDVETVVQLINQNAKAKHHVNIGVDAEDYYRIKDSEKKKGR